MCWTCGKTGHIAAWCRKGGKKNLYAMDDDDSEDTKEYSNRSTESEEAYWKRANVSSGKK